MRKTTKERLAKADKKMLNVVRDHLDYHMIRVRKWLPYNGRRTSRDVVYEAFIDHGQVNIPVPTDRYSFYVCMHEIGHIVKGERNFAYMQEYVAEQYAIAKCMKHGYLTKEIEDSAKRYVFEHMVQACVVRVLPIDSFSKAALKWTGSTEEQLRRRSLQLAKRLYKDSDEVPAALERLAAKKLSLSAYKALLEITIKQLTTI